MHPFDFPGINISHHAKAEVSADEYKSCFIREMPDDLIIVPDLERMVSSLILAMVKELYLARGGGDFDGQAAAASHNSGMAQVNNPRMREMMHRKLLNDMISNAPIDPDTNEPALTAEEIRQIYDHMRGQAKSKNEPDFCLQVICPQTSSMFASHLFHDAAGDELGLGTAARRLRRERGKKILGAGQCTYRRDDSAGVP
jgi:hypothetical protein